MNFLTHILISKTVYRRLSRQTEIDKGAFLYGNIKPDLTPKCLSNPHTLDNYLFIVCGKSNQLLNQDLSVNEFSEELGVLCHHICDFFCYYHSDSQLHHKLFAHFIYELRLHFLMRTMLLERKITFSTSGKAIRKNIGFIIMEMRKEYLSRKQSPREDIRYAFLATIWSCESILSFSKTSSGTAA